MSDRLACGRGTFRWCHPTPGPLTGFVTTIENPGATSLLAFELAGLDGVGLAAEPVTGLFNNSELINDRLVKSSS